MKTPIYNGTAQSDLDFAGFKPLNADLSDYGIGSGGSGLDENTVTADDIGLVGDGVTNNTVALQSWIDQVAEAGVSSTLLVPDGVYIFSGPLQNPGGANSQILLPNVPITQITYSITIKGYHPISYIPWPDVSMPTPRGPIFKSTLATGGGAFIGGIGPPTGITPNLSFMAICFEDMIFQTIPNPTISCLDLSHYSVVQMRGDVLIMAGTGVGENDTVQPTTPSSHGLKLPPNNSGMVQRIENVAISNFYIGCLVGELSHIINIHCEMCYYALEFEFAYHMTLIERIVDWHCPYGVKMLGTHTFQVQQYDVERDDAGFWSSRVYDIDDATNLATADITWWTVVPGIGPNNVFTINGGANVRSRRAGGASTVYVGTDFRLVPISGGAKVQVRNPGTGLWADADQWTNP